MLNPERKIIKSVDEFEPQFRIRLIEYIAGGTDISEALRQEAKERGIDIDILIRSSLNLFLFLRGDLPKGGFALRNSMGYEEEIDLMNDKFKPRSIEPGDSDRLGIDLKPEIAKEFVAFGKLHKITPEEVLGRVVMQGIKVSEAERGGQTLMLKLYGQSHPIELIN